MGRGMGALRALGSGVAVYVLVVACSGAAEGPRTGWAGGDGAGGQAGAGPSGGASGADDGGIWDAVADAITDPVPPADAGEPPDVAEEACDLTFVHGGTTYMYAEHAYPGRSVAELASVRVVLHYTQPNASALPPGYERIAAGAILQPGKAAVNCGPESSPTVSAVTFVLP